jgi:hypothetical protein
MKFSSHSLIPYFTTALWILVAISVIQLPCQGIQLFLGVRVRVTLRLAVYRQSVPLGAKPLETHGTEFFQLNPCGHSPYVTSSLTRGWVCRLQLLLILASAVILVVRV